MFDESQKYYKNFMGIIDLVSNLESSSQYQSLKGKLLNHQPFHGDRGC
jgi:hypothetical protein